MVFPSKAGLGRLWSTEWTWYSTKVLPSISCAFHSVVLQLLFALNMYKGTGWAVVSAQKSWCKDCWDNRRDCPQSCASLTGSPILN